MEKTCYDVLTCASVLPTTGLDTNLFLRNLPVEDIPMAVTPLLQDGTLRLGKFKIMLNDDDVGQAVSDSKMEGDIPCTFIGKRFLAAIW